MPSATWMETSISYWMNLLTSSIQTMLSPLTNSRPLLMALPANVSLQKGGTFVVDGRMAPPPGKIYLTSRNLVLSKLLSLQLKWRLPWNPVLTAEMFVFSRKYPVLSKILELDKAFIVQRTQRQNKRNDIGACAWHMLMMSQRTKDGGMGIYRRGFLGIMREAQLGITLSLPVIDEEEA